MAALAIALMAIPGLATVSGLSPLGASAAQAAPGDPFNPADPTVFVSQQAPTILYQAVTNPDGDVQFEQIGGARAFTYNAISYNSADNYLYGLVTPTPPTSAAFPPGSLIRIGQGNVVTRVGSGIVNTNHNVGAFGPSNLLYTTQSSATVMNVTNVVTGVTTTRPLAGATDVADWTFADGFLWGISSAPTIQMVRVDPASGAIRRFPVPAGITSGTGFGAAWTFGNGNLGFIENETGTVSQISVTNPGSANPTFTLIAQSNGPSSNTNDGAASAGLPTDLAIVKDGPLTVPASGGTITYTLTVTNNGPGNSSGFVVNDTLPAPLTNVTSSDPNCTVAGNDVTCVGGRLLVGASVTFTVTATAPATVTAPINNTATVLANEADPNPANDSDDHVVVPAVLTLVKNAGTPVDVNGNGITDAGDTIQFTFDVTNGGTTQLTNVGVNDPLAGAITCPTTTLDAAQTLTCAADAVYVITDADVTAGAVRNTATATGTTPDGVSFDSPPSSTETPTEAQAPAMTVDKIADVEGPLALGDEIVYSFEVSNTGNVTLTDVTVNDDRLTAAGITVTCPDTELAPGESTTCVADEPYVVTESDIIAGSVVNTATSTGTPPTGPPVDSPPDEVEVPTDPQAPAMTVDKIADVEGPLALGDEIVYSFEVSNTGNVTLTDVTVNDDRLTAAGITVTCPDTELAPGESTTCVADEPYVVTESDIIAGSVVNTATSTGTPPTGPPVDSPPDEVEVPTDPQTPAMTIDKTSDADGAAALGDEIVYSFEVSNTGNVTLTDVTVNDDRLTAAGITVTCPDTELAPGESTTCVADEPYVVTESDVIAGSVENTATSTGTPPGGTPVDSPPDTVEVPTDPAAGSLAVEKSTDVQGPLALGDEIVYSFEVSNTGNVTLTDVTVNDDRLTAAGITVTCPDTELAPGESTTCVADEPYVVTESDIIAGSVVNTATSTGTPPTGPPVDSPPDEVEVPTDPQAPAMTVDKIADVEGPLALGDEIVYSFEVSNTGNVTLTDVTVNDDRLTAAGITVTCPDTELAPGESTTCVADEPYVVTESDIIAGSVVNTATSTGTPPTGPPVDSPPDEVEVPTDPQTPAMTIDKTSDADGAAALGDEIVYSFEVSNTGNVTLTDVTVNDDRLTAAGITVTCPDTELAPGESTTCVADEPYVVTESDVIAGSVENTATSTGTPPGGTPVDSPPDTVEVPTDPAAGSLAVEKSTDVQGPLALGDEIVYSFEVSNTGNVTLTDVTVNDDRLTAAGITVTCPDTELAPGESTTCVADEPYVVTESDIIAGSVVNTATSTGTPPTGPPVDSPPDEVEVPTDPQTPALELVKSAEFDDANDNGAIDVGETILYSFAVTNTGNVSVTDVAINDPMLAAAGIDITCDPSEVAPNDTIVCVADEPYVVTQADVDAGKVENTAIATGTPPGDTPPIESPPSTTTTPGDPVSSIAGVKSADLDDRNGNNFADAGETIVFTVTVTNTGNVSLSDVTVDDPLIPVTCPTTTLAPGASVACVSAPYTVTAADVVDGQVLNQATVSGTTPGGDTPRTPTNTTRTPTVPLATPPALPRTGAELAGWTMLSALLLLAVGGGSLLIARRRDGKEMTH